MLKILPHLLKPVIGQSPRVVFLAQSFTKVIAGKFMKVLHSPRIHGDPQRYRQAGRSHTRTNSEHSTKTRRLWAGTIRPSDPVPKWDGIGAILATVGLLSWHFLFRDALARKNNSSMEVGDGTSWDGRRVRKRDEQDEEMTPAPSSFTRRCTASQVRITPSYARSISHRVCGVRGQLRSQYERGKMDGRWGRQDNYPEKWETPRNPDLEYMITSWPVNRIRTSSAGLLQNLPHKVRNLA